MNVEDFEPRHFEEWQGEPAGFDLEMTVGYTLRDKAGYIYSLMMVFLHPGGEFPEREGQVWGCFDSHQPVPLIAHKYALKIKDVLRDAGIKEVFALPDMDVPHAEKWLHRLGFRPDEGSVWRLDLVMGN